MGSDIHLVGLDSELVGLDLRFVTGLFFLTRLFTLSLLVLSQDFLTLTFIGFVEHDMELVDLDGEHIFICLT